MAGSGALFFLLWVSLRIDGPHVTLWVDDIGQGLAAWCAALVCGVAAYRSPKARSTWAFLAASSFAWGAGEVVWCYYALVRNTPVPFPSLADVGFLIAVPLAIAGLLLFPTGPRRSITRVQEVLDGCIIAASVLFASWSTVLGALYRTHEGGAFKQAISLAYPVSDVIMVSLVVILLARVGRTARVRLGLVMAGIVAFAFSDSAFAYLTEVNNYNGGGSLDTGWVAGYLLIALGAIWAITSPAPQVSEVEESTISIVAPYVPVLIVLAVTAFELVRGHHLGTVSWLMAVALAVLVIGREAMLMLEGRDHFESDWTSTESDDDTTHERSPDVEPALSHR